jgi:hypothetical protein
MGNGEFVQEKNDIGLSGRPMVARPAAQRVFPGGLRRDNDIILVRVARSEKLARC